MENKERPALYVDPKLALEVTQQLKAIYPDQLKDKLQDAYGVITERDLIFYSLGKKTGLSMVESVRPIFAAWDERLKKQKGA